ESARCPGTGAGWLARWRHRPLPATTVQSPGWRAAPGPGRWWPETAGAVQQAAPARWRSGCRVRQGSKTWLGLLSANTAQRALTDTCGAGRWRIAQPLAAELAHPVGLVLGGVVEP